MGEKTYVGLADAHGIEQFFPEDQCSSERRLIMSLRANANRQRHAVAFSVVLDDVGSEKVIEKIKAGEYVNALHVVKLRGKEVRVESALHAKSWEMIPNPDLDPYHASED